MPSTLTTKQKLNVFSILEVPYFAGYYQMDGMGALSASVQISGATQGQAKAQIEAHLDALATEVETELKAALDEYEGVKFTAVKIENGGVADINGLTCRTDEKVAKIKLIVQTIVPFFKFHETIAKQQGNSPSIMAIR